jgi:hypothetical protein
MITLIIIRKKRKMRIIQTFIFAAATTSNVFCSYKSPSICPNYFILLNLPNRRIWSVKSVSGAVSFRSYEQIDAGNEFYFSQKSCRVTWQCSGLRMLESKTYCSCYSPFWISVLFFALQISIQFSAVVSYSLSFLSTNFYYISNAKTLMFSNVLYFYLKSLSLLTGPTWIWISCCA